jgi:hypothetical protein
MYTPLLIIIFIFITVAIILPLSIVGGKIVYHIVMKLCGGYVEPPYNKERVDPLVNDIKAFTELYTKIRTNIRLCSNTDVRKLREVCGCETIDTFDSK